jgi:hypothetical protein
VAIIEMLTVLKREFRPELEVCDEGEYWQSRNADTLIENFRRTQAVIDSFAEGLERHGLTSEAAEDQEILLTRIKRIAGVVHRTLRKPAEHPPVRFEEDSALGGTSEEDESHWDDSYKENRRRQERIARAIEERLAHDELHHTVEHLQTDIFAELARFRHQSQDGF